MRRREMLTNGMALAGIAALPGCATRPIKAAGGDRWPTAPLAPLRLSPDRIIDVKCCLRPFRARGPRLEAERIGDALVVHNYGHGGSGWSLAWGSAEIAVNMALAALPGEVAVVGCGIIGLTSALVAQRAGLKVTIYARDLLPRTRSVRANGSWTPDSRIALTEPAGPAFAAQWERMARLSWKTYRSYLGLPGRPVDFADQYRLSDTPFADREHGLDPDIPSSFASDGLPRQSGEFAFYRDRLADINPKAVDLAPGDHPFPVRHARRGTEMFFNFASLGHLLLSEFFQAGGRFEMRMFHDPAEIAALPQKTVINCPGYAARDLWRDRSVIPVRGQTGWLIPQPEANYGLYYRSTSVLSKSDGVMVQSFTGGLGDMAGLNDSTEIADRAETEEAVKRVAPLFQRMGGRA